MCYATRYENVCMDCGKPTGAPPKLAVQRCTEPSCRFRGESEGQDNDQKDISLEPVVLDNAFCSVCRDRRRAKREVVSAHLMANLDRMYRDDIDTTFAKHKAYLEKVGKCDDDDNDKDKEKKKEKEKKVDEDEETDVTNRIPGAFCTKPLLSPAPCTLL